MPRLYSPRRAQRFLRRHEAWIEQTAHRYALPARAIRAVICQELTHMDWMDVAADAAVGFYWLRYDLGAWLQKRGLARRPWPLLRRGFLGRQDSSTGCGQIFARTAIRAICFALDRGLASAGELGVRESLREDSPGDKRDIWRRLHRDVRFNIVLCALALLRAVEEVTGGTDTQALSPLAWKKVFSRYNARTVEVTPYGEAVYARAFGGGETG